jgi:hypothetical protein
MNETGSKKALGEDYDYLRAITCDPENQSLGVYTANIHPEDIKVQVSDK